MIKIFILLIASGGVRTIYAIFVKGICKEIGYTIFQIFPGTWAAELQKTTQILPPEVCMLAQEAKPQQHHGGLMRKQFVGGYYGVQRQGGSYIH